MLTGMVGFLHAKNAERMTTLRRMGLLKKLKLNFPFEIPVP